MRITFLLNFRGRTTQLSRLGHTHLSNVGVAGDITVPYGIRTSVARQNLEHRVTMAVAARNLGRVASNTCYFFVCDMQEKFRPSIRYFPEIITVAKRMVSFVT